MINTIIDIYHGNVPDFAQVKAGGILAVIHKATQGSSGRDSEYAHRKKLAKDQGLLWGAYHFSTGEDVAGQVENFLDYANPQDDELISLDWEPNPHGPTMNLAQARQFVQMIRHETGRWPVLYGGHLLRESIGHSPDPVLANCPLWYARYAPSPVGIPAQVWPTYTLWQYTDGNDGPPPQKTPGVGGADRNIFNGTAEDLASAWPLTHKEAGAETGPGFQVLKAKKS